MPVRGQPRFNVSQKSSRSDVIKLVGVAVVSIYDANKSAVLANILEKLISAIAQAVVAGSKSPRDGVALLYIEPDANFRMKISVDCELGGVSNGKVDLPLGYLV